MNMVIYLHEIGRYSVASSPYLLRFCVFLEVSLIFRSISNDWELNIANCHFLKVIQLSLCPVFFMIGEFRFSVALPNLIIIQRFILMESSI